MKTQLSIYLFLILLLSSCNTERDLSLDVNKNVPDKLVINGLIEADTAPVLFISSSHSIYRKHNFDGTLAAFAVKEAKVHCYVGDKLVEEAALSMAKDMLTYEEIATMGLNPGIRLAELPYRMKYVPQEGDKLRIDVASPGYETVRVEIEMPKKVKDETIKIEDVEANTDIIDGSTSDGLSLPSMNFKRYRLTFTSPLHPSEAYFGVAIQEKPKDADPSSYLNGRIGLHEDIIFSRDCRRLTRFLNFEQRHALIPQFAIPYFSSAGANTSTMSITIVGDPMGRHHSRRVAIYSLSRVYYEYGAMRYGFADISAGSDDFDLSDVDNPMAEKRISLTNVRNGRGVVLARTPCFIEVEE